MIVLFKHEMRLFEKYSHHREPRAHHSLALVKASLGIRSIGMNMYPKEELLDCHA